MSPDKWKKVPLDHVARVQTGLAKGKKNIKNPVSVPYLRVANVQDGYLDLSLIKEIEIEKTEIQRYLLKRGDVLLTEGGDFDKLGRGAIWQGDVNPCLHQNHIFVVRPKDHLLIPQFLSLLTGSFYGKAYFLKCSKQSTNLASINSSQLKEFPVILPPIQEQESIIEVVTAWDQVIEKTDLLISAKEKHFSQLSGRYLFGGNCRNANTSKRTRWFSVPDHWKIVKVGSIAKEVKAVNVLGESIPVLSCTKYDGLVDSLTYFDKQIFSMDTSTYKVVSRGQFAYATNHIEEGSIGYQDLYEKGLVSPMYTVFETDKSIHDGYLYKILKTETYRHIFQVNTSASVDRRGSLRWNEFANLPIPLPPLDEQQKISVVLGNARAEIDLLKKQADAYRKQKRGLMQKLLTGQWRVKTI